MRRRSRIAAVVLAGLLVAALAAPAGAIVFGQPDTQNKYRNVGSIVVNVPELGLELLQWCSGTLISETVFLTAAHCTAGLEQAAVNLPTLEVLVTFDQTISPEGTFFTGTMHSHPDWNWFQGPRGRSDPADIAVIVLDESPGITPASLPPLGLLDQLSHRVLRNTTFTAVGYGSTRDSMTTAFQNIDFTNLDRNFAEQSFFSLAPAWLTLAMVHTPGLPSGGTCFGDSGGPHFIHLNGIETDIVASITVTGDVWCKATDKTYRVDTPRSLNFLAEFVDD
jgi:hypothetical protein